MIGKLLSSLSPAQKGRIRGWYFNQKAALISHFRSFETTALKNRLREMGIRPGDTLMLHSAFGPFLGFKGSPSALIDAYLDVIGPTGNLLMPSMPFLSAASEYLKLGKVFDARKTQSKMGLVTEIFRRRSHVLRSLHPTHPVLAYGPKAEWIVSGHEHCKYTFGPGSPFVKLLELNGRVVFHGVTEFHFTFHHYLEDMIKDDLPFALYEPQPYRANVIDASGQTKVINTLAFTHEAISRRRVKILFDALDNRRQIIRSRIGNTKITIMSTADTVVCTQELARKGIYFYQLEKKKKFLWLRNLVAEFDELQIQKELSPEAKSELHRDRQGLHPEDPGIEKSLVSLLEWICRAQDFSKSADSGVARVYHLKTGWSTSYPETTGYIIPTLLDYSKHAGNAEARSRAEKMLNWLCAIQLPEGGFQGGRIDSLPVSPVVFNTGQILIGLARGELEFGKYREPMKRAADWLVEVQDPDGAWRSFPSPFAEPGVKSYDTHVAWGLLEAERIEPNRGYAKAALANVDWALTQQSENGWFAKCCLSNPKTPLTHTLGYALRGVVEAYRFTKDVKYLIASQKTADGLIGTLGSDGFIPGTFNSDWSSAAKWVCLTGSTQIAICWFMLNEYTGETRYLDAAIKVNKFVRRTLSFEGSPGMAGGVKGSFPLDGEYSKYEYPNWAAKFLIDSLLLESKLAGAKPPQNT